MSIRCLCIRSKVVYDGRCGVRCYLVCFLTVFSNYWLSVTTVDSIPLSNTYIPNVSSSDYLSNASLDKREIRTILLSPYDTPDLSFAFSRDRYESTSLLETRSSPSRTAELLTKDIRSSITLTTPKYKPLTNR